MLYEVITQRRLGKDGLPGRDPELPDSDGDRPAAPPRRAGPGARGGRGRGQRFDRQARITSYNVCYTKLLRDEGRIARKLNATGYPPTLETLVEGVEDQRHPDKRRIYFLRRLPGDPLHSDGRVPVV